MLSTFVLASMVIIVVPGVDMALVTRQVLSYGRHAAFATLAGLLTAGLTHATLAAVGLSALLVASATAYTIVRITGATYLVVLGAHTLWVAQRRVATGDQQLPPDGAGRRAAMSLRRCYVLGLTSNLTNPKMAVFFLTFLPQFVAPGPHAPLRTALLGVLFNAMASTWWTAYVLFLDRAAKTLHRPKVRQALERVTGAVLIGLGLRLAVMKP